MYLFLIFCLLIQLMISLILNNCLPSPQISKTSPSSHAAAFRQNAAGAFSLPPLHHQKQKNFQLVDNGSKNKTKQKRTFPCSIRPVNIMKACHPCHNIKIASVDHCHLLRIKLLKTVSILWPCRPCIWFLQSRIICRLCSMRVAVENVWNFRVGMESQRRDGTNCIFSL